jgi:hypothetical protein
MCIGRERIPVLLQDRHSIARPESDFLARMLSRMNRFELKVESSKSHPLHFGLEIVWEGLRTS